MYHIHGWKPAIQTVEVASETAKFAVILEKHYQGEVRARRRSKEGYYNSWEECRLAEVARRERVIDGLKTRLQSERSALGVWLSLKP